jgi:hypothetical protein
MRADIAKFLIESVDDDDTVNLRAYEGYSGRFMFGETTTGLVYDHEIDLTIAVARASARVVAIEESAGTAPFSVPDLVQELKKVRKDSLGRSSIIY